MRVTNAVPRKKRVKRVLKAAKGYRGSRSKTLRDAKRTVRKALKYAYAHRRRKKRDYRRLWIVRINAGVREAGLNYSEFMHGLKLAGVAIDRRQLSELAIHDQTAFRSLVEQARFSLVSGKLS